MTSPAPSLASFTTRRAGIRQALIDADVVGRAVYHPAALDQARAPYVVLTDNEDAEPVAFGDGRVLRETTTGEARLIQANSRDADPHLAPRLRAALDGLTFLVTPPGGTPHKVFLRATGPTSEQAEGLDERTVRWVAYQDPATP